MSHITITYHYSGAEQEPAPGTTRGIILAAGEVTEGITGQVGAGWYRANPDDDVYTAQSA